MFISDNILHCSNKRVSAHKINCIESYTVRSAHCKSPYEFFIITHNKARIIFLSELFAPPNSVTAFCGGLILTSVWHLQDWRQAVGNLHCQIHKWRDQFMLRQAWKQVIIVVIVSQERLKWSWSSFTIKLLWTSRITWGDGDCWWSDGVVHSPSNYIISIFRKRKIHHPIIIVMWVFFCWLAASNDIRILCRPFPSTIIMSWFRKTQTEPLALSASKELQP